MNIFHIYNSSRLMQKTESEVGKTSYGALLLSGNDTVLISVGRGKCRLYVILEFRLGRGVSCLCYFYVNFCDDITKRRVKKLQDTIVSTYLCMLFSFNA